MRKFSCLVLTLMLLPAVIYLCSCASGGVLDPGDPITPLPELREGVVDPMTRMITITKEDITVSLEHWSRRRLNRKYTTVDMRSPFFYLDTWEQAFQSEVFEATITNNTPRNVIVNLDQTIIEDEREYVYKVQGMEEFDYKFVTKKMKDLRTKRGYEVVGPMMLNSVIGEKKMVPPGMTLKGYISFPGTSSIVTKLWVRLILEKEPETATGSYEKVEFRFDFQQDPVLRKRQLPVRR